MKLRMPYAGHRERIKEKYARGGLSGWLDYEVLEFALSYALARKDTKPIAKELLVKFKSLDGVLDADRKELEKIKGISRHTALFLNFLKDMASLYMESALYNKNLLSSPSLVFNYLRTSLKGRANEEFKVMFLNSKSSLLAVETLQTGTVNKTAVYPRKIVERALYCHSTAVIAAHNHPGGSLTPSEDDYKVTKVIKEALKVVEIVLLDHIIIGADGYFSFKEKGLL